MYTGSTAFVLVIALFYSFSLQGLLTLLPLYANSIGVEPALLGLLVSFPAWFLVLLRIPSGALADKWGERAILIGSTLLMAFSVPLYVKGTLLALVMAQALTGLSRTAYHPAAESYMSKNAGKMLGAAMGLYHTLSSAGLIAGPVIAGYLVVRMGYAAGFVAIGAGGLVSALLALRLQTASNPTAQQAETHGLSTLAGVVRSRAVLLAGLSRYAAAVPLALLSSLVPLYLSQLGMSPQIVGGIVSLRGLFLLLGSLTYAVTFNRWPKQYSWFFGLLLTGTGFFLMPFFTQALPLAVCVAVTGFGSSPLQILPVILISENTPPEQRGLAIAFSGTMWGLALVINPLLFGVIAQFASLGYAFYAAAVPLLALSLLTKVVFRWAEATNSDSAARLDAADDLF